MGFMSVFASIAALFKGKEEKTVHPDSCPKGRIPRTGPPQSFRCYHLQQGKIPGLLHASDRNYARLWTGQLVRLTGKSFIPEHLLGQMSNSLQSKIMEHM